MLNRDSSHSKKTTVSGDSNSANVTNSGNVTQSVTVEATKSSKFSTLVIPLIAAILGAGTSAYATHKLTELRAANLTVSGTNTLLGTAKSALDIAQSNQTAPELIRHLEQLSSQAQAIQASAKSLSNPPGGASLQADFWLRVGQGAQLLGGGSLGVQSVNINGNVILGTNDGQTVAKVGSPITYTGTDSKKCKILYMGTSPDGKLFGFKSWCDD